MRRIGAFVIAAVVMLCAAPATAVAGMIQLDFSGSWTFFDPYSDSPQFWDDFASAGVFQGTPLSFSMLVDTTDQSPASGIGTYTVRSSRLRVGTVTASVTPWSLGLISGFGVSNLGSGSLTGPPVGSWIPFYFQLEFTGLAGAALPADSLMTALPLFNSFSNRIATFGFTQRPGCGICLGTSNLTLTRVSQVPGPSAVLVVLSGLVALGAARRRLTKPARARS